MKFKFFNFGKKKNKKKPWESKTAKKEIGTLEEQLSTWTNNLKQTEQRLNKLTGKVDKKVGPEVEAPLMPKLDAPPIKPHGPIRELVIDPEGEAEDAAADEELEVVKLVEVKKGDEASAEKEGKGDQVNDSFKELFIADDDEDNPLTNLIHSLPEVTTDELEEDLKEIKDIIKDWQRK